MAVETYTGRLGTPELEPLVGRAPMLWAELDRETVSEWYLLTTEPVQATLLPTGEFSFRLQPSDLIAGSPPYRVFAVWLDGAGGFTRRNLWKFHAMAGGGIITDMVDVAPGGGQVFYQPTAPNPWPPGALWWNSVTDDVQRME